MSCEVRYVQRNGKHYKVTSKKHSQIMPWGIKPVVFYTAKWEAQGKVQMQLFDD